MRAQLGRGGKSGAPMADRRLHNMHNMARLFFSDANVRTNDCSRSPMCSRLCVWFLFPCFQSAMASTFGVELETR